MSASVTIDGGGILGLATFLERMPEVTSKALSLALNDTARDVVLPAARRDITQEVNFPQGYLTNDRLYVSQYSTPTQLEARVAGRDRPTSLLRFAKNVVLPNPTRSKASAGADGADVPSKKKVRNPIAGKGRDTPSLTVEVKPGVLKNIPGAFAIALRNGNFGMAIRLSPGQTLHAVNRFQPIEIFTDVYLLYGPSVQQAFSLVALEIQEETLDGLTSEFYRQLSRLNP